MSSDQKEFKRRSSVHEALKRIPGFALAVRSVRAFQNRVTLAARRIRYPLKLKKLRELPDFRENSVVVMTVLILKENILFLEEWIEHHLRMGVSHFYLYDNSAVEKRDDLSFECLVEPGKVNKHGRRYDDLVSDAEAKRKLAEILSSYAGRITVVPWGQRDEDGFVRYFQREALLDFLKRAEGIFDYCLFIDLDEFMVSRRGKRLPEVVERMTAEAITSVSFKSRLFSSRFNYVGRPVLSISMCLPKDREDEGYKTLFRIAAVLRAEIHCTTTLLKNEVCPNNEMLIYHYCHNSEAILRDDPDALIPVQLLWPKKR